MVHGVYDTDPFELSSIWTVGQNLCSSQVVGRIGEQVTLLCLANELVQNASWAEDTTNNITFRHLNTSDAGLYTCSGTTVRNEVVSSSINLLVSGKLVLGVWLIRKMKYLCKSILTYTDLQRIQHCSHYSTAWLYWSAWLSCHWLYAYNLFITYT